jgi:hypothetical protein
MLVRGLLILSSLAVLSCSTSSSREQLPFVCKASDAKFDTDAHNGHFASHENPNTAKRLALQKCREHHSRCFIDYCNHDFKVKKF